MKLPTSAGRWLGVPIVAALASTWRIRVDGAPVTVVTAHGRATFKARISPGLRADVVVVPHGWRGAANANQLTAADATTLDPISGFPRLRSEVCRVEAARTTL